LILAVTGHRPELLGGYNREAFQRLRSFARVVIDHMRPTKVRFGMAQGWDQACFLAALDLGIPAVAYLPFQGMEKKWCAHSQAWFSRMLLKCEHVHVCCEQPSRVAFQVRNEVMVQDCDGVLALWSGSPSGTGNCVRYATGEIPSVVTREFISEPKPVDNVWADWIAAR
jgi:hypothetical protein